MDDRSLLAELKATLEARRREDPLVIAMSSDVKEMRTKLHGLFGHMSFATGNASAAIKKAEEAIAENAALRTQVEALHVTVFDLRTEIDELKTQRASDKKELDSFIAWAQKKGKT